MFLSICLFAGQRDSANAAILMFPEKTSWV